MQKSKVQPGLANFVSIRLLNFKVVSIHFRSGFAVAVLAVYVIIFVASILRSDAARQMFLTAVIFALAAIPTRPPAVVTISLARGAYPAW